MPKQNNELARRVELAQAELIFSLAMQSQTLVDRGTVEEMVARQVAEMLTKGQSLSRFFGIGKSPTLCGDCKTYPNSACMCFAMNRGDAWSAPARTHRTVGLICAPAVIPTSFSFKRHPSKADRRVRCGSSNWKAVGPTTALLLVPDTAHNSHPGRRAQPTTCVTQGVRRAG